MVQRQTSEGVGCRLCGMRLSAWLPIPQEPDRAMLLGHLAPQHLDQGDRVLGRMHATQDIMPVAVQALEPTVEHDMVTTRQVSRMLWREE